MTSKTLINLHSIALRFSTFKKLWMVTYREVEQQRSNQNGLQKDQARCSNALHKISNKQNKQKNTNTPYYNNIFF